MGEIRSSECIIRFNLLLPFIYSFMIQLNIFNLSGRNENENVFTESIPMNAVYTMQFESLSKTFLFDEL